MWNYHIFYAFFSGERGFIGRDDLVIFKALKNRVLRWGIGEKFHNLLAILSKINPTKNQKYKLWKYKIIVEYFNALVPNI